LAVFCLVTPKSRHIPRNLWSQGVCACCRMANIYYSLCHSAEPLKAQKNFVYLQSVRHVVS